MLDPAVKNQLKTHFENLVRPVQLVASLDDTPRSAQMAELLDDLAEQSPLLTVVRRDDSDRRPSFAVVSEETGESVRFAGLPLGHEFTSLVLAILQVGGHPSTAAADLLARVEHLEGEYRFETFFSQSCQNCPDVVQALNLMSVLNPGIVHTAIDGAAFQEEASERQVMAVPTVFLNGEPFGQGRMSLEEIVDKLDTGSADRRRAEIEALAEEPFDVLVVGGGPAGASAAIYAARKGIRTAVIADRFGGQVLDTLAIENLVSVPYTEGPKLAAALEEHVNVYGVDVLYSERAARLVPGSAPGDLVTVELESGPALRSRTVVIATGARWRNLGVPGEAELRNKGVTYCPHCDGPLFAGKRVAVVGGGNSGVEAAIDLAGVVAHVTLVEYDPKLRADEVLQRKLRSLANVDVVLSARTTEVTGESQVTGLVYEDRQMREDGGPGLTHRLDLDGVFVQIGLLPNTEWLAGGDVVLSDRGEVVIDDKGATSVPGVYAAGDCTIVAYKQIVVALGAGSTAALGAFDHLIRTTAPAPSPSDEVAPVGAA